MNSIIKFIRQYRHGFLPLIYAPLYLAVFCYLEQRPISDYHVIHMAIDDKIPFCEYFVIPYYLWFLYVAATVILFIFLDRKDFYKLCLTLGAGMTIFLLVSYFYPNIQQLRPSSFTRDNIFIEMVKAIYRLDTATNLFPSIHCFNSLAVNAAITHNKQLAKFPWISKISLVLCSLIILSTLFIKQHSVFDLLTAFGLFTVLYLPLYLLPYWKEKAASPVLRPFN